MKVAACGNIDLAKQVKSFLTSTNIELTHFINDNQQEQGGGVTLNN